MESWYLTLGIGPTALYRQTILLFSTTLEVDTITPLFADKEIGILNL